MKFLSFILIALSIETAFAVDTPVDSRHLQILTEAISSQCGISGEMSVISNKEEEIRIDQGIIDYHYNTQLSVQVSIDQNMYDEYLVATESELISMYDHASQNWGVYNVIKVTCPF